MWAEKTGVWCAIDFEAWDKDHTALTEVGWSFVRWVDGEPQEEYVHLRVEEHRDLRNIYVPSNPDVSLCHHSIVAARHSRIVLSTIISGKVRS